MPSKADKELIKRNAAKRKKARPSEVRKGLAKSEFGALGVDLRKVKAVGKNLGKQMNAKELLTTRAGVNEFIRRDREAGGITQKRRN